jgi:anti-sigma factor ChrR (cupin superfamily)
MEITNRLIIDNIFDIEHLLASRNWESLSEGVKISKIYSDGDLGPQAAFIHYLPKARVPTHNHLGFEHILILQGSQQDGAQIYSAGTLVIHAENSEHSIYSEHGCLALGVWVKPVQFL